MEKVGEAFLQGGSALIINALPPNLMFHFLKIS